MDEEERLELERLRLGAAGQRASDDYEAMVNAPSNKVNIPSFGQPAPGIIPAAPAMPSILGATPAMEPLPTADEVALPQQGVALSSDPGSLFPTPITDSVGQSQSGLFAIGQNPMLEQQSLTPSEPSFAPTPVTNVGLMGEPLREQPSVEEIRRRANQTGIFGRPLPPGAIENSQESLAGFRGFFTGLGRAFTDPTGSKMRAERYGVPAPAESQVRMDNPMMQQQPIMSPTPLVDSAVNSGIGPFQPGAIDFSKPPTTNVPSGTDQTSGITMGADGVINLPELTRESPEATFLRADGSIGEIFPGQRIGDAFPGNPDTPLVGGPLVQGMRNIQGVDLPGGTGFVRAPEGMVPTLGPDGKMVFTTPEQANAMAPTATGAATATGAEGSVTAGEADGFSAPTRTGSRAGRLFDDVKGFFREGISGAGGVYDYFTDPNSPTLESIEGRKEDLEAARQADERARTGSVRLGEVGSIQRNFANRMATGEPLTQAETAAAMEFARFNNLNFDPKTGYSQAPMATAPQVTEIGSSRQLMSGYPRGGPLGPVMLPSGSGANLPTLSSVNAMSGTAPMVTAPQGRPALSAYEQASMDREAGIAARPDFNEAISDRDRRAARGEGLSQADLRDLAQGSARGATEGERMRALQIQQRAGMGAFKPGTPRVDKLSQATSTVDRMIQNGQLSPDKRNAAIQRIVGLGDVGGAGTSADAGVIGSAEFDRISAQLQPGGSLYEMGIRVDPSRIDPLTGAAQVYREKPGLEFGPPAREMVSPELVQQLLPYLRSVKQPNVGDFAGVGMVVNQFAGSR
jgi:hypothetical protein